MIAHTTSSSVHLQAKLFRAFADPSRLSILDALLGGPLTVTQIVETTGLTQSNVSNHLSCLRDCGLVLARQQGRYVYYRLGDPRVGRLLELSHELLQEAAMGVDACPNYGDTTHDTKVPQNGRQAAD